MVRTKQSNCQKGWQGRGAPGGGWGAQSVKPRLLVSAQVLISWLKPHVGLHGLRLSPSGRLSGSVGWASHSLSLIHI